MGTSAGVDLLCLFHSVVQAGWVTVTQTMFFFNKDRSISEKNQPCKHVSNFFSISTILNTHSIKPPGKVQSTGVGEYSASSMIEWKLSAQLILLWGRR